MTITPNHQSTFDDIRALARAQDRPLCDALKEMVYSIHSAPNVLVWPKQKIISFGVGPKKMSQHYVYIGVQSSYVNLGFYRGAFLDDPDSLLEGTGNALRHVKVRDLTSARSPGLRALVETALAERRPFAAHN
jgi:hypothetical protein